MPEDYAAKVMKMVPDTPNTQEGITRLVDAAEEAITAIDGDLSDVLASRRDMVILVQNYSRIFRVLFDEELRSRERLKDIEEVPTGMEAQEDARKIVMEQAAIRSRSDETVTDSWILSRLRSQLDGPIPWRNPRAVIGTILTRSGQYTKAAPGKYKRKDEA